MIWKLRTQVTKLAKKSLRRFGSRNKLLEDKKEKKPFESYAPLTFKNNMGKTIQERTKQIERKQDLEELPDFYTDHFFEEVISLVLFLDKSWENQKVEAILNYHKVAYERNFNPIYIDNIGKEITNSDLENRDDFKLPALRSSVSMQHEVWSFGENQILKYILEQRLLPEYHHITNSAFSQQGTQYAIEHILPQLDLIFLNPFLQIEVEKFISPENMMKQNKNLLLQNLAFKGMGSFFKIFGKSIVRAITGENKEEYYQARDKFLTKFTEFEQRLGKNRYHGGETPDEADFTLYGILKSKLYSDSFRSFLEKNLSFKMVAWLRVMDVKCRHEVRFYEG